LHSQLIQNKLSKNTKSAKKVASLFKGKFRKEAEEESNFSNILYDKESTKRTKSVQKHSSVKSKEEEMSELENEIVNEYDAIQKEKQKQTKKTKSGVVVPLPKY
jgi:hypothetical protein